MSTSRPLLTLSVLLSLTGSLVFGLAGCPQEISSEEQRAEAAREAKQIAAADDRIAADTSDLYAVRPNRPPTPSATRHDGDGPKPGSGAPDESNGVCRLFAPEHPQPVCCDLDLGFDVDTVQQACGERLYMGESFHATCGYYFFKPPAGEMMYYRLSYALGKTVAEAAGEHDERLRVRMGAPADFASTAVPGVPGALWSSHEDISWAFIPGWRRVRQLTWRDADCDREGVAKIIKQLAEAPPVPTEAGRGGKLPKMRTAAEIDEAVKLGAREAAPTPVAAPD